MPKDKTYTDNQLREALIKSGGSPVKASEMLGVTYTSVYTRVRKNPALLEVQKAYRAKVFNDVANTMITIAIAGIIKEPITDENGNVIKGKFKEITVDYKTRMSAMQTIMSTFKAEDGITDKLDITSNGKDLSQGFVIEVIDKREDVRKEDD